MADVEVAETAGVDAIGLVLIGSSPRALTRGQARELSSNASVPVIVLTQDLAPPELIDLLGVLGAHGAQPYGDHSASAAAAVASNGGMALLPIRVREPVDLAGVPSGVLPLLDGHSSEAMGGTGTAVAMEWLPRSGERYVLAGGLTPDNVAEAVNTIAPWGVDASSGLESSPGVKDPQRIRAFIEEAKNA